MAVALLGAGVVLTGAAALSGADPAGVVIMGLAGLLLLGMGAAGLYVRPRLAIVDEGLALRSLRGTRVYTIGEIVRIRVVSFPRFGRSVPSLEIDVVEPDTPDDERLLVLGRWDLGAHPLAVADALRGAGFPVADPRRS
ncbi:PH domain-containing protein [Williamsia sp. CHRR-6]|uniref:PH domain-containing protein n=1 Tax=Williamsia sp. CHRR-6 TaxID=2835871 RepID=UPI001BDA395F|nr:PH domain-containing protein [Williamsia sp. CHRR-6]MBT0567725.1 PH domain-containing protein [Williamsia sp. CHRR-6]